MSLALKASKVRMGSSPTAGAMISRRAYMGDPGLFGFLGDVVGVASKFLPGPIGTAATAVSGLLGGGGGSGSPGTTTNWFDRVVLGKTTQSTPGFAPVPAPPVNGGFGGGISINPPFGGAPGIGITTYLGPTGTAAGGVQSRNGAGPAPSGYHWNKSDYFLKNGTFVPKGTRLVKNRRRNPLNPRAASRAISRLESAKKATKRLQRISIKCNRCGYSSCRCK